MNIVFLIALAVVSCCSYCVYGIASFGDGMLMQVLLQVCYKIDSDICDGNISTATLSISIALFFACPIQLYFLWKHVDWGLALQLSLFQAVGTVLGVRIIFYLHSIIIPRILGLVLYLVLVQKILADVRSRLQDPNLTVVSLRKYSFHSITNYASVWATGLSSGLLSGMFGAAGPPLIIFSSAVNLEKDTTRGTVAFCDVIMNLTRLAAFVYSIMYSTQDNHKNGAHRDDINAFEEYSLHQWVLYAWTLTAGALTGLYCGNVLARHVDQFLFKYILLTILGVGSMMLGTVGMSSVMTTLLSLLGVSIIALLVLGIFARSAGSFAAVNDDNSISMNSGDVIENQTEQQKQQIAYQELTQMDHDCCENEAEAANNTACIRSISCAAVV